MAIDLPSLDAVLAQLSKKATFERGVRSLTEIVNSETEREGSGTAVGTDPKRREILTAVSRVATLLKTRYTTPGLWSVGLRLFETATPLAAGDSTAQGKLQQHIAAAQEALGQEQREAPSPSFTRPAPYHFEGQLSVEPAPAPHPQAGSALPLELLLSTVLRGSADAGTALESQPIGSSIEQLLLRGLSAANRDQEGTEGQEEEEEEAHTLEGQGQGQEQEQGHEASEGAGPEPAVAMLESLLASIAPEGIPGLEEAIQASMQAGEGVPGAPPAAKKEVESLPTFKVGDFPSEQKGAGSGADKCSESAAGEEKQKMCAVCQEPWQEGDTVRQMPCSHRFHVDCLQPWLEQRNSCPMCRHELPTDDISYELKKERDKQEAEDRAGAANAVTLGDYMYL